MSATSVLRIQQKLVIEFLTLEGSTPIKFYRRKKAIYRDCCMDVESVPKVLVKVRSVWFNVQRFGRVISLMHHSNQCRVGDILTYLTLKYACLSSCISDVLFLHKHIQL